jgi:asparagine synthase (glutamine-hydrolysing)
MSALAGLCRWDGGPVNRGDLERMVSALAHRGMGGPALTSTAAGLSVTADARLDNRHELSLLLGLPHGEAVADAELILRAYERWGVDCVGRLVGDFAFAIWDGRNHTLLCARDHIGARPFYYHETPGAIAFASEIKALLTNPAVPYRLEPLRVADHLIGLTDDTTLTFYRGIRRLPAGHTLTATRTGARIARYWALDASRELALGSDGAYVEAFLERFTEAVRCRLAGSKPVGCLLSGGLDTSSIVAAARQILGGSGAGRLKTFSAIFPGLPPADLAKIDERSFIDALVAQGGLEPQYVRGDLLSPLTDVDRVLWHLDEPFPAPNLYLHWALYGAARERGVRGLLDGIDGDTTVSHGLERLAWLASTGRVLTLARELRALSRRYGAGAGSLLRRFVLQPLVPARSRHVWRRLGGQREAACLAGTVIRPEFARQMRIVDRMETFELEQGTEPFSPRAVHCRAMRSGLIPYALEMANKAAAAFGVEPRYPFFDRRLMELSLALPADQKLRDGWPRLVMRRAMQGALPDEVRWRATKANLTPNFSRNLLGRDRDLLEEVVVGQPGLIEEYVDIPALRSAYRRCVAEPASTTDALAVFGAVVLALWLQRAKVAS